MAALCYWGMPLLVAMVVRLLGNAIEGFHGAMVFSGNVIAGAQINAL